MTDMTLGDVFEDLALDALSSIQSSVLGAARIDETREQQVTKFVNDGLTRLHSRYVLHEEEAILDLIDGRTEYYLDKRYAKTQEGQPGTGPYFIRDTPEKPFINNVLRILSVWTDCGRKLPINDAGVLDTVFTPRPDMLQIPCVEKFNAVSVLYQANHPKLRWDKPESHVHLPAILWPALTAYVAHRMFSAIGTQEANLKAQEHLITYNFVCDEVDKMDLVNSSLSVTTCKFQRNGWV